MLLSSVGQRSVAEQPGSPPWKTAAGISILAHLAVGVAMVFGLQKVGPTPPAPLNTAMAIEIMPAPAAPPSQVPPEPQEPQPPAVEQSKVPELPPIPAVPNVKAAVVVPPKEARPVTPPSPPPPPPAAPVAQSAPAAAPAAPAKGAPVQGVASDQQNYDSQIVAKLERRKRYPSQAMQQKMEDVVFVRIVIDRSGHIVSSDIVRSKNFSLLDNAVRDLVRRIDPLPPIPKSLPGETYAVTVPIDFFINRSR